MNNEINLKEKQLPSDVKSFLEHLVGSFVSNLSKSFSNVRIREKHYSKEQAHEIYKITAFYSFDFKGKTYDEKVIISADYKE